VIIDYSDFYNWYSVCFIGEKKLFFPPPALKTIKIFDIIIKKEKKWLL
jgi:hypothetical protein